VPRALRALRTPAPPDRPTLARLGQGAAGGGGGSGGGGGGGFEGGRVLEVSFGRNSNAHALRVPLPRRGHDGSGGQSPGAPMAGVARAAHSVDDTVTLHFGPPASPWRPAAEVYANASPLAAAPLRKKRSGAVQLSAVNAGKRRSKSK